MKILITGSSGTGKTTLGASLQTLGYFVIDADRDISEWIDPKSKSHIQEPAVVPDGWRSKYVWSWNRTKLLEIFAAHPVKDIVVCGNAANQEEFYRYFDHVIFLHIDPKLLRYRLLNRTNNPYGKNLDELNQALKYNDEVINIAKKNGYILIESDMPADTLSEQIRKLLMNPTTMIDFKLNTD